jgi:hypothetical protein
VHVELHDRGGLSAETAGAAAVHVRIDVRSDGVHDDDRCNRLRPDRDHVLVDGIQYVSKHGVQRQPRASTVH